MIFKGLTRHYYAEDLPDSDSVSDIGLLVIIGVIVLFCLFL